MSDYRHHTACRDRIIFVPIEVPVAGSPKSVKGVKPGSYPATGREAWSPAASRRRVKGEATVNLMRRIAEQESDVRAGWMPCVEVIIAMPGNGDTDMLLAMVSEELDTLETRLGQLGSRDARPQRQWQYAGTWRGGAAPLEEALAQALKNDRR